MHLVALLVRVLLLAGAVHVHASWADGAPAALPQFLAATDGWYWPAPTTFDTCWCREGGDIWLYVASTAPQAAYHTYDQYGNVIAVVYGIPSDNAALWALISHEVVEAAIDPYGGVYEAADGCPWFSDAGIWLTQYRRWAAGPCEE